MNLYLAESLIADRNRSQAQAQERRWPDLARAQRLRAGRLRMESDALVRSPDGATGPTLPRPVARARRGHHWTGLLHGLFAGGRVTQR